jgi:hypothetical protein
MTRLQSGFGIGISLIAMAIPIILFARPHPRIEKGDRVAAPASRHVVRVIQFDRPHVSTPEPAPAPAPITTALDRPPTTPMASTSVVRLLGGV